MTFLTGNIRRFDMFRYFFDRSEMKYEDWEKIYYYVSVERIW